MPSHVPVIMSTNITRSKQKIKMRDRMQQIHTIAALIQPGLDMIAWVHRLGHDFMSAQVQLVVACCRPKPVHQKLHNGSPLGQRVLKG